MIDSEQEHDRRQRWTSVQESEEGEPVPVLERVGQSLVIPSQLAEPAQPAECPFDHLAARQKHKAPFGFRMFHDFQFDRQLACLLGCGVTASPCRQRRVPPCHPSHLNRQFRDLRSLLFVGGSDRQSQQVPQRIHRRMRLRTLSIVVECLRSTY